MWINDNEGRRLLAAERQAELRRAWNDPWWTPTALWRRLAMTIKNREMFPVGTRVKPYAKRGTRVGTVEGHTTDGRMNIRWDGAVSPLPFYPFEVRRA
jgi:hypothetical protein